MRKLYLPFLFLLMSAYACPLVSQTSVSSVSDLEAIVTQCASDGCAGMVYDLTQDLDLNGQPWAPIGSASMPFKGQFRGNGHTIKGLRTFSGSLNGAGLFGFVGQDAIIEKLGISGGQIVAKAQGRRRIGAIAGVCDGTIRQCWSMAMIAAAGNVCGGLVGELDAHGLIEDCYHSGLILNGADTIAGIVGYNNGGALTRVYNIGYAKNGKAIVHTDKNGVYNACYYDRKLYYQTPGVVDPEVIPMDDSEQMFGIFADQKATWIISTDRYPMLKAFNATSNAVQLSVAPIYLDKVSEDPVNHANTLTQNFTLSNLASSWVCQDNDDKQWLKINGTQVTVVRPCSETDILVNATSGAETRVVYFRPERWKDFQPGSASGEYKEFCFEQETRLAENMHMEKAEFGWETARYYYMMEISRITASGDTVPFDTLYNDEKLPQELATWFNAAMVPTNEAGEFVIRRYAHDSVCVHDWMRSKGEFVYRVYEPFDPGEIENKEDYAYLPLSVSIASIQPATGGKAPITYNWVVNESSIDPSNTEALTDYTGITAPGVYTFARVAMDAADCHTDNDTAKGRVILTVLEPFDPGEINEEKNLHFCTLADAMAHIITATEADGGLEPYQYQWYTVNGTDTTVIDGATNKDLSLNNGISLQAGHDYTFVRKAKDSTGKIQLMRSRLQQTFHIMALLNAGTIANETRDNYCAPYDADPMTLVEVAIEGDEATGEANLEYQWVRIVDGEREVISGQYKKDLNVTLPLFDISGNTYTYIREVRNHADCEWVASDGKVTQYYGQDTRTEVVKVICRERLPYTMTWIDGTEHTFTDDGEKWEVHDTSGDCDADTVFVIKTVETPSFSIDTVAHVCQDTRTMALQFTQKEGMSDRFRITFSPDMAKYMGRTDTVGTITSPGWIFLTNVPPIGTGDCYLNLQIGYAGGGESDDICFSEPSKMRVDFSLGGYLHTKYDRVLFVDNNPDNGLITGGAEKLKFVSYQWYKDGKALEGETGQYYHQGGQALVGTFYVLLTAENGDQYRSCEIVLPSGAVSPAPERSVVYPVPVGAGQPMTIRGGASAQVLSFSGALVGQAVAINEQVTVSAPTIPGLYYVQVTTEEGVMEMHKIIVQ